MSESTDTIDLFELGRAVRHGWWRVAALTVVGAAAAAAVIRYAPKRFDSAASVVVRSSQTGGAALLSRLGGTGAELLGTGAAAAAAPIETELQILSSRDLAQQVVDSLRLQVVVRDPAGVPSNTIVRAVQVQKSFAPVTYVFDDSGTPGAYRVTWPTGATNVDAARSVILPGAVLSLAPSGELPNRFEIRLFDEDDAIDRVVDRLSVSKAGGEVIRVAFAAADSITAAAAPNALITDYLALRHATDQGVNHHRLTFLSAKLDSVSTQLTAAEVALRDYQQTSGVLDPVAAGKIQLEQSESLRKDVGSLDVERGALDQLMTQVASGKMSVRQLIAFPSFLKSGAVNDLLSEITKLETQKAQLLERRLPNDADVVTLDQQITAAESMLMPLATAYRASLDRQRTDVESQLDTLRASLGTLPGTALSTGRLQRAALGLEQEYAELETQVVEARLAAISEGGDVRQLDIARPPRKPGFPRPAITVAIGVAGGLLLGLVWAMFAGVAGRWIVDPRVIERTAGVPAILLHGGAPLLVSGRPVTTTILLVPLDGRTSTAGVAERLARTAAARAQLPTILDLSATGDSHRDGGNGALIVDGGPNATIERLEQEFGAVIVRLPGLASEITGAVLHGSRPVLLVTPAHRIERRRLVHAVETLRRLNVPCAGIVMNGSNGSADAVVATR